jgi:hypothetical protein
MVVPIPRWCKDYVPSIHCDPFAVDSSEPSVAFYDEACCEGDVPVSSGGFVWHDELKTGVERISCIRAFCKLLAPSQENFTVLAPKKLTFSTWIDEHHH